MIVTVWWTIGFNFILYLAGLIHLAGPVRAAALTAPAASQADLRLTLPLLAVTTTLVVVLQVIASLKLFDQVYLITAAAELRDPQRDRVHLRRRLHQPAGRLRRAASLVLFVVILIVSFVWLFLIRKQEGGLTMRSPPRAPFRHGGIPPARPRRRARPQGLAASLFSRP